jgi:histidinol dehydrogenase
VRKRGDKALLEYARKFDGFARRSVRVPKTNCRGAAAAEPGVPARRASAAANIRDFAKADAARMDAANFGNPGMRWADRAAARYRGRVHSGGPLSAALHADDDGDSGAGGGRANDLRRLPEAGDEVFGTAAMLGVTQVFQMGGAQAIAAFAYGTRTVPKADRIVGPGNIYVAAAKKLLAGEVGIDFVAGPTEI